MIDFSIPYLIFMDNFPIWGNFVLSWLVGLLGVFVFILVIEHIFDMDVEDILDNMYRKILKYIEKRRIREFELSLAYEEMEIEKEIGNNVKKRLTFY